MRTYLLIFLMVFLSLFASCKKGGEDMPDNPAKEDTAKVETRLALVQLFDQQIGKQKDGAPRDRIFIVAHRANTHYGALNSVPDNSIPGIEYAIKYGADMVELDVRPTKDKELVLMHNSTIDASTTGKGEVSNYTYEELMQFDLRKGSSTPYRDSEGKTVKIPTLKEALLACKDKIYVNLDIKDAPVGKLVRIIKECGMEDQVMLYTGGNVELATEYQYADMNIQVHPYINAASDIDKFKALPGAKLFQYGYDLYASKNPEIGREIRAKGFLSYSNLLNYDSQVASNNFKMLDAFIACESDFIQTDYAELVDKYLKEKGLR